MTRVEALISAYGLIAVYLVAIFEGDLSLILAGVLGHLGLLPFPGAIIAGAAGNLTGDLLWFLGGQRFRERIRRSRLYRAVGPRIDRLAARLGPWQLLAARVVWGTRNASMVYWGQHGLPLARFVLIDSLGCVLAAAGFVAAGAGLGHGTEAIVGEVRRAEHWLLIILAGGGALVWAITRLVRRRLGD